MIGHERVMTGGTSTPRFVRSNEELAFAELYNRHRRSIQDYCRRRVAGDLVDDVVAETFLTAWRRLDDVPAGDGALLWLYRVAYRLVGHEWRSNARRVRLEARLRFVVRRPASACGRVRHRLRRTPARARCRGVPRCYRLGSAPARGMGAALDRRHLRRARDRSQRGEAAVASRRRNLAREYRRLESRPTPDAPKGGAK